MKTSPKRRSTRARPIGPLPHRHRQPGDSQPVRSDRHLYQPNGEGLPIAHPGKDRLPVPGRPGRRSKPPSQGSPRAHRPGPSGTHRARSVCTIRLHELAGAARTFRSDHPCGPPHCPACSCRVREKGPQPCYPGFAQATDATTQRNHLRSGRPGLPRCRAFRRPSATARGLAFGDGQ